MRSGSARSGRFVQMARLVDPADVNLAVPDIDLVEAARALFEPPVGRQRQVEKLQKECARLVRSQASLMVLLAAEDGHSGPLGSIHWRVVVICPLDLPTAARKANESPTGS